MAGMARGLIRRAVGINGSAPYHHYLGGDSIIDVRKGLDVVLSGFRDR